MGRRPTKHLNLPAGMRRRVHASGRVFYYYEKGGKDRKEISLGNDYALALKKWVELQADKPAVHVNAITFAYVSGLWQADELPGKAVNTQRGYLACLHKLLEYFRDEQGASVPLESIEPQHVKQFMRWRGPKARVQATYEKRVLSLIWNWARGEGFTGKMNPCLGIQGTKAKRDVYIEDDVFKAVWDAADVPLREALDLGYLMGQRPADTLKIRETDYRAGVIMVQQNKTDQKLRMEVEKGGELENLIERIKARKAGISGVRSLALIVNETGQPIRRDALRYRFDHARSRAIAARPELEGQIRQFQFRDLRAKAGTDKAEAQGMRAAQKQLGHKHISTTEIYLRNRRGAKVTPTKK